MHYLLLMLVILFLTAIYYGNSNHQRKKELRIRTSREDEVKELLKLISIKQVAVLNEMLKNKDITLDRYYFEMDNIYQQCVIHDIDVNIIKELIQKENAIHGS